LCGREPQRNQRASRPTRFGEPDGAIVREIDLIGADGGIRHFRQTFRRTGDDTAVTTLVRQRADGTWEPNFPGSPGSDKLIMTRRRDAADAL
jgi:hypothetical protein